MPFTAGYKCVYYAPPPRRTSKTYFAVIVSFFFFATRTLISHYLPDFAAACPSKVAYIRSWVTGTKNWLRHFAPKLNGESRGQKLRNMPTICAHSRLWVALVSERGISETWNKPVNNDDCPYFSKSHHFAKFGPRNFENDLPQGRPYTNKTG